MIILIGSTRAAKVEGVREALAAIASVDPRFASVSLHPHDLTAVAPRMPMSVDAIVDGAERRARALLAAEARRDPPALAVGLEGGLARLPGGGERWTLQTWAAVSDGARWGVGAGPALLLPAAVVERVVGGEELGDVVDAMAGVPVRGSRGAWGLLTCDLIGRREAFRLATVAAFAPFYHPAAWATPAASPEPGTPPARIL